MKQIEDECRQRGIKRLCHFTQSRNLAHIFDDPRGICSTELLKKVDLPFNPTDDTRGDGRPDLICCTIEYPNTFYFSTARTKDKLFNDWVVLLIDPKHIWQSDTCFCPCNALRGFGRYITNGVEGFTSLFDTNPPGSDQTRNFTHLDCVPTDFQAEVLVADVIPISSIIGIVVKSEEQAKYEIFRLKTQKIDVECEFVIAPDFFDRRNLVKLVQSGNRPIETTYEEKGG